MVLREATVLISLATEEFIKRFIQAIHRVAEKERRSTLQPRDVGRCPNIFGYGKPDRCLTAMVVNKVDEFTFLEGSSLIICIIH